MKHFFIIGLSFLFCLGIGQNALSALNFQEILENVQTSLEKSAGGVTERQETEMTDSYLISCSTGVKDMPVVVTGVEVAMKDGWTLHHPHISASADSYQATVLPQFRTDLPTTQNWTESYQNYVIFPIILKGKSDQDISLNVQADWTMCPPEGTQNPVCIEESHTYTLPLLATEAYRTTRCAALNRALVTAAVDMSNTTTHVETQRLENGDLRIRFTFPKPVKELDIRAEKPYESSVVSAFPDGNVWTMILHLDNPVSVGDTIPFSLRTTQGCYTANVTVSGDSLPALPEKLPLSIALWTGVFLFLLSPAWSLWLAPQTIAKTGKQLTKSIWKIRIALACGIVGLTALWLLGVSPSDWIQYSPIKWLVILGLLWLIWKPVPPLWIIAALICFLPKPFWDEVAYIAPTTKICISVWWVVCCWIPFNVWILCGAQILKFFKSLEKDGVLSYPIAIRLPYLILFTWLAVATALTAILGQSPTWEPKSEPEPAIVKVVEPVCLNCIKDDIFFFSRLNPSVVSVYQTNPGSDWARQKKSEYGIHRNSFNILITKTGAEILLPYKLSQQNLKEALKQIHRK